MPVIIVAAAIAAAAALIGAAIAAGDNAKAQAIREDIAKKVGTQKLPVLDKLVAQKLPPESLAAWDKITKPMQAQSDVLGKYMDVVNEKGETASDRASYLRMKQAAGGIANNAQASVQRGMAQRGLEGSGMSFALQQQGAQAAANRANEMGIMEAGDARNRYMQALGAAGTMSGQMRGQDADKLRAQDAINMFNARAQSDVDRYNAALPQQNFDNEMSLQTAEANARNGVAAGYDRGADRTRQTAAGVGNAAATMAGYETDDEAARKYKKSSGAA